LVTACAILDTSAHNATMLHVKLITSMLHMFRESCHLQADMCTLLTMQNVTYGTSISHVQWVQVWRS